MLFFKTSVFTTIERKGDAKRNNHEIDYELFGNDMQFIEVEVELDSNETVIAEVGALMVVEGAIKMEAIFGDSSDGLTGKLMGAGKHLITGESLFITVFSNEGKVKRWIPLAFPYISKINPMDLSILNGKVICHKDTFLAAVKGVTVGVEFQRKLRAGFFGGEEGFLCYCTVWVQSLPFSRLASRVFTSSLTSFNKD